MSPTRACILGRGESKLSSFSASIGRGLAPLVLQLIGKYFLYATVSTLIIIIISMLL